MRTDPVAVAVVAAEIATDVTEEIGEIAVVITHPAATFLQECLLLIRVVGFPRPIGLNNFGPGSEETAPALSVCPLDSQDMDGRPPFASAVLREKEAMRR